MSKPALVKIGHAILKRLPKSTLVNTVHKLEQLAKSKGIRSIGKIARKAGRKARKVGRKAKTKIRRRAKTARSYPLKLGGKYYKNGRTFKSRRKPKQYDGKTILIAKNGQPYIKKASGRVQFIPRIYA